MDFAPLSIPPFPFLQLTAPHDPFTSLLASIYDPSGAPSPTDLRGIGLSEQVKKEEAGTQATYILQDPLLPPLGNPSRKETNKKRPTKNSGKMQEDGDYIPSEASSLHRRPLVKQKQDRNLIPNTVHQLLSFVQQQYKSRHLADRIIRKLSPRPEEYSLGRFYNFHRMLRGRVNSYVNEGALLSFNGEAVLDEGVYPREEQGFYCLVSRVMMRHFLRSEALLLILTSRKVRRENRLQHLSVQRYLHDTMICQEL